jgi:hypothetical protein
VFAHSQVKQLVNSDVLAELARVLKQAGVHAAQILFPGAAERSEARMFGSSAHETGLDRE